MHGTLVPAFGRDYKSKRQALADWNVGKNFNLQSVNDSGYINREQAEKGGMLSFQIRWKKLTMVGIIKAGKRSEDAAGNVSYADWM